jgi:hypothetical protein
MPTEDFALEIRTCFDETLSAPDSLIYSSQIRKILKKILTKEDSIKSEIPTLKWFDWSPESSHLSLFLLCLYRPGVGKFFYDMIGHWLLPGKHLNIALNFSINFKLPQIGEETYTISEIVLSFDNRHELEMAQRNFFFIEKEILLGAGSFFHATRILEMKGLSLYDKTALIQERISQLLRKKPREVDYDIFALMQHFLISSKDEFKSMHDVAHMSRLIAIFYFFHQALLKETERAPGKRTLFLKIKKIQLHHPLMIKQALAFFVGLNFLKENEIFEKRHLLAAINHLMPDGEYVEDSYFVQENKEDKLPLFYLEIEKKGGGDFLKNELEKLRLLLPDEIKKRIEQLLPPLFMPRNEEEVMRNILVLSRELKFIKDIPQMIISFDEQSENDLSFTVVLVRIQHPEDLPLKELFAESDLQPLFERAKIVGMMRKKYPKEAVVFRVKLSNQQFLRDDHSLDLYQARLAVAASIQKVIGSVRDYNGGMISKQNENFMSLKGEMPELASKHSLLLQNFFYSIFPIEQSATLDPKIIKNLFLMLLDAVEKKEEGLSLEMKSMEDLTLVMARYQEIEHKEKFLELFHTFEISPRELATMQLKVLDVHYLGFIYLSTDPEKQMKFRDCFLEQVV